MTLTAADSLSALEARIAHDLELIAHPNAPWLPGVAGPDGKPALDVLVVGAGQGGVAVGFGLKRAMVTNVLLVDSAKAGFEGPWLTYARMPTLRSPKDLTGPDLDIPSLTYRAWHEAKYGADHWKAMKLIPKEDWNDYILFVRRMAGLKVENETTVTSIAPTGDLLAATLVSPEGERVVFARKIVLATGQEGVGRWTIPDEIAGLPAHLRAHNAEPVDFAALKGKVVAVLGAGASAFDNAATALEAGAKEAHLFCRRADIQTIQPYRWLTFRGFLAHLGDLSDEWRWRFMSHILGLREGFPQDTYDRCARHANFTLWTGAPWTGSRVEDGRVIGRTPQGDFACDFVIAGAGVTVDYHAKPELKHCADNIATWTDRYSPPDEEADARLGAFPYLGADYSFTEKRAGETPWLKNLHLFAIGSTMSHGPSGSSINAMTTAVPHLVRGVTRGLFAADVEAHWASLKAYDARQAIVRDSRAMMGPSPAQRAAE